MAENKELSNENLEQVTGGGNGYNVQVCPLCTSTDTFLIVKDRYKCRKCGGYYDSNGTTVSVD